MRIGSVSGIPAFSVSASAATQRHGRVAEGHHGRKPYRVDDDVPTTTRVTTKADASTASRSAAPPPAAQSTAASPYNADFHRNAFHASQLMDHAHAGGHSFGGFLASPPPSARPAPNDISAQQSFAPQQPAAASSQGGSLQSNRVQGRVHTENVAQARFNRFMETAPELKQALSTADTSSPVTRTATTALMGAANAPQTPAVSTAPSATTAASVASSGPASSAGASAVVSVLGSLNASPPQSAGSPASDPFIHATSLASAVPAASPAPTLQTAAPAASPAPTLQTAAPAASPAPTSQTAAPAASPAPTSAPTASPVPTSPGPNAPGGAVPSSTPTSTAAPDTVAQKEWTASEAAVAGTVENNFDVTSQSQSLASDIARNQSYYWNADGSKSALTSNQQTLLANQLAHFSSGDLQKLINGGVQYAVTDPYNTPRGLTWNMQQAAFTDATTNTVYLSQYRLDPTILHETTHALDYLANGSSGTYDTWAANSNPELEAAFSSYMSRIQQHPSQDWDAQYSGVVGNASTSLVEFTAEAARMYVQSDQSREALQSLDPQTFKAISDFLNSAAA